LYRIYEVGGMSLVRRGNEVMVVVVDTKLLPLWMGERCGRFSSREACETSGDGTARRVCLVQFTRTAK
jgi:hypothetical protein